MSDLPDGLWLSAPVIDGFTQSNIDPNRKYQVSYSRPRIAGNNPFERMTITDIELSGQAVLRIWNDSRYQLFAIRLMELPYA